MCQHLRSKGVSNHKFMLTLYRKELEDVDVHAEGIPDEIKLLALTECRINPWYFFREVVRIPIPGGETRFELHLGNMALIYCALQNLNVIEVLPRQHYKTISSICIFLYLYDIATSNSKMIFSNKEQKDSRLNLARLKDIRRLLPQWLIRSHKKDTDNVNSIRSHHPNNMNSIEAMSTANDEESADKLGRGLTTPNVWFDEFAFLKYNDIIYEAASPAAMQASIDAKRMGKPHFKLITTTPNNIDIPSGSYCWSMIEDAAEFHTRLYDKNADGLKEYIDSNSKNDYVYIEYDWKDLGRNAKWFRDQCRALNNNMQKIKREILLEWTRTADLSIFTEDQITAIEEYVRPEVMTRDIFRGYVLKVVEFFDPAKPYVIGVDTAGGLSRDFSALIVVDPSTSRPVAHFRNNKIELDEFYKVIEIVHQKMFPVSALAVERSAISLGLIQKMVRNPILKRHMVYTYDKDETKIRERRIARLERNVDAFNPGIRNRIYGVKVTKTSREQMFDLLQYEVTNNPDVFAVKRLVREIALMQRDKHGRIDHAPGQHDDVLMSYLNARHALANIPSTGRIISATDESKAKGILKVSVMNAERIVGGDGTIPEVKEEKKKETMFDTIINLNDSPELLNPTVR